MTGAQEIEGEDQEGQGQELQGGGNGEHQGDGPPGSPPLEDLPGIAPAPLGVGERPKGSVKLFCGQIGRDIDPAGIRAIMEPYGKIYDISIIKDKVTGLSKGCAFVTFNKRKEAVKAMAAVHGVHTVPGMSNAVQVNYAKGEEPELQPEAKLFVANIPKTANEEAIRVVFQPYGDIEEVFIMKEKGTGDSKGCGFVKFEDYSSADAAVKALHQQKIMEGGYSSLIVKFADPKPGAAGALGMGVGIGGVMGSVFGASAVARPPPPQPSTQSEHRLFIGSLPKTCDERELESMMAPYGALDEVYLMREKREQGGASKCAAFVRYKTRQSAQAAVTALHEKVTMTNAQGPLIVRFANPPNTRAGGAVAPPMPPAPMVNPMMAMQMVAMTQAMQKKQQQQQMQSYMQQQPQWGVGAGVMARPQPPQPAPPPNPYAVQGQFGGYEDPYGVYAGGSADAWPVVDAHAQYAQQQQQQYAGWGGMEQQTWGGMEQQAAHGAYGQQQQAYQYTQPPQPQGMATNGMAAMAMAAMTGMGMGMGMGGGMGTAVQKNGPEGCNLFIYHIPAAWTDQDIAASFSPFGNIVSATVMKDKNTGAHKGFGFVSYDAPSSAQVAIRSMNGMQVDGKRLKVELKTPRPAPY